MSETREDAYAGKIGALLNEIERNMVNEDQAESRRILTAFAEEIEKEAFLRGVEEGRAAAAPEQP